MKRLTGREYSVISVGMSGAEIRDYGDMILKIQPRSETSANEASFMRFLKGKILVPDLIAYETRNGFDYLLMSKLNGKMLCDNEFLKNPAKLFEIASEILHKLWKIPVEDCPIDMSLDKRLRFAEKNVIEGAVDLNNVEPTTFGKNGRFKDPEDLLFWLKENRPEEDFAVTHGDLCLPNVLRCGEETGLIDFPYGGMADRYWDISLLYRSMKHNLEGRYGKRYCDFDEKLFFDILSISPDRDKIDYYILLDELF